MRDDQGQEMATAVNPWWKKSAAPLAASIVLAVCAVVSWALFHSMAAECWGKGGGATVAEAFAVVLGVVALLTLALSWVLSLMSGSRVAVATSWVFAAVTVLLALGVLFLGQSPNC